MHETTLKIRPISRERYTRDRSSSLIIARCLAQRRYSRCWMAGPLRATSSSGVLTATASAATATRKLLAVVKYDVSSVLRATQFLICWHVHSRKRRLRCRSVWLVKRASSVGYLKASEVVSVVQP